MSHEAAQCNPDVVGKETICNARDAGSIPGLGTRQPTPVFLPGRSHGQRSLVGCSPGGRKESDTTEHEQEYTSVTPLNTRLGLSGLS